MVCPITYGDHNKCTLLTEKVNNWKVSKN